MIDYFDLACDVCFSCRKRFDASKDGRYRLSICRHSFHRTCLQKSLDRVYACPLCETFVAAKDLESLEFPIEPPPVFEANGPILHDVVDTVLHYPNCFEARARLKCKRLIESYERERNLSWPRRPRAGDSEFVERYVRACKDVATLLEKIKNKDVTMSMSDSDARCEKCFDADDSSHRRDVERKRCLETDDGSSLEEESNDDSRERRNLEIDDDDSSLVMHRRGVKRKRCLETDDDSSLEEESNDDSRERKNLEIDDDDSNFSPSDDDSSYAEESDGSSEYWTASSSDEEEEEEEEKVGESLPSQKRLIDFRRNVFDPETKSKAESKLNYLRDGSNSSESWNPIAVVVTYDLDSCGRIDAITINDEEYYIRVDCENRNWKRDVYNFFRRSTCKDVYVIGDYTKLPVSRRCDISYLKDFRVGKCPKCKRAGCNIWKGLIAFCSRAKYWMRKELGHGGGK